MTHQIQIIFQEVPRDFRTQIPNIVFEMLENGLISNSDFILYCTYRKIVEEDGGCTYGSSALSKKSGLSFPTIAKSKRSLSRSFEILGGKSLIYFTPRDLKKENIDIFTITDIWKENHQFSKKQGRVI